MACFCKERKTYLYALAVMSNLLNLEYYQLAVKALVGARSPSSKKPEPKKRLPVYGGMPFDIDLYPKFKQESL